ncbi:diguanylate cyclase domain-containing protein [uncultured Ruminococcus sp.]|uniref:sensor domain-containing diguanylate cyclase n=1 Tax=uncultured Ruminococcus sp. TaxID=165186 RepID=UPI0025D6B513|nr:diguanylate cyclase [uncultured Ruminococcus sp.]
MDMQEWIAQFDHIAAVYAFDILADGSCSEIRIAAANKAEIDYLAQNYPNAPDFYSGIPLRDYFTEINLENFVIKAVTTNIPLYSYVNAHGFWIKSFYIPLKGRGSSVSDEAGRQTRYCLLLCDQQPEPESEAMSQRAPEVSAAVMQITIKMHQTQDYSQSMCEVTDEVRSICGAKRCALYTFDRNSGQCRLFGVKGERPDILEGISKAMGRTPYENALFWERDLDGSDCLLLNDMDILKERDPVWCKSLQENGIYNIILYAIREHRELVGFIWAANYDTSRSTHIKEALELTAFLLASKITNQQLVERLEYLSSVDELTNVSNSNALNRRIKALSEDAASRPAALAIIVLDLNGLKRVNDLRGHSAGDKLITKAASLLKIVFGDHEIFRSGGDEFVILCPDITQESMDACIGQLRTLAAATPDVSFAVGAVRADGEYSIADTMKLADDRMYIDKEAYYSSHPELERRRMTGQAEE